MKSPVLYLFETLLCSGMLLGVYRLLLVGKVSFRACRIYLVAAVLLSVAIPALDIPVYPCDTQIDPLPLIAAEQTTETQQAAPVAQAASRGVDFGRLFDICIGAVYLFMAVLSTGSLTVRLLAIRRLRLRARLTRCEAYTLAEHRDIVSPFSFLRTIFLGETLSGDERDMILRHEASHVGHRHSVERIVLECVCCLCWFNPFVRIAGRWLREVQEWEADSDVLRAGYDLTRYRMLIFRQLFGYNPDIACGLNHSLTKNRFLMMTRFRKRRYAAVRLGAAIPVVAGMMMLCSFTVRTPSPSATDTDPRVSVIRIGRDGSITANGRSIDRDSLAAFVAAEREKLSAEERANMVVRLEVAPDVTMEPISGVKESLRRANVLRVSYASAFDDAGQMRMLPPDPAAVAASSGSKVKLLEVAAPQSEPRAGQVRIALRNCFEVRISASGIVSAGSSDGLEQVDPNRLQSRLETFLRDASTSERELREFALSDGRIRTWAVCDGIVSLCPSPEAPYGKYLEVQHAISRAYRTLRADVAREWFSKRLDALSEEERAAVLRAVPLKLTESILR